jgi:hypothetical protein
MHQGGLADLPWPGHHLDEAARLSQPPDQFRRLRPPVVL